MDFAVARDSMVETQLARRGVRDPHVLDAMRQVPREAFIGVGMEEFAYEDRALPLPEGQAISQPYIVAAMLEAAGIEPGDRVLEIGTGSGYAAAVLSRMAAKVYTIERHPALANAAAERFRALGYGNIELKTGDGSIGWPQQAPFDAIVVSAGSPKTPSALKAQLLIGGRLILPVGPVAEQRLLRITRVGDTAYEETDLGGVIFVKLIGTEGFTEDDGPVVRGHAAGRTCRR